MTITVDFWQLVMLSFVLVGAFFSFGKMLLGQFERRLEEKFETISVKFKELSEVNKDISRIDKDLMNLRLDMTKEYVRQPGLQRIEDLIGKLFDRIGEKVSRDECAGCGNSRQ